MKNFNSILGTVRALKKQESGAISVLVAVMLPAFLGMGALVVDLGMTWETRRQLQNCSDAAALAGAVDLGDTVIASAIVTNYLYLQTSSQCISPTSMPQITPMDRNNDGVFDAVEVITHRTLPYGFAKIFGSNTGDVSARAVAGKITPYAFTYMEPFGLQVDPGQQCNESGITDYTMNGEPLEHGRSYTIKFGPPGLGEDAGSPGNFQALALGATGADAYGENIENGYPDWVSSCDMVRTETGNMVMKTINSLDLRLGTDHPHDDVWAEVIESDPPVGHIRWSECPRVINIAIINPIDPGRSEVQVLTFGWFLVESYGKKGNRGEMTGRFIEAGDKHAPPNQWIGDTPWDPDSFLPFGVKLLE